MKMPGPKCVVRNCQKTKSASASRSLAFHKFPRDLDLKRIWFEKLGIKHLDLDYGFVCSRHFERDQYKRDLQAELLGYVGRRKLKPDAVPTLHLPIKQEKISPEEKERLAKEQHKKLIQDCLNRSSEEKSILGFELFKKLKYTQTSTRGRPKKNVTPQRRVGKNVNDEHQNIIRYYDGEPRVYLVSSDTDQDLHSSTFEDSTIDSFTENRNPAVYSYKDMSGQGEAMHTSLDDPEYMKEKIKKLESCVNQQSRMICALRRQIDREKKMKEKIILATSAGSIPINRKKKNHYDEKARSALLHIYSMSPNMYSDISKALNLPSKSILASWNPEISSSPQILKKDPEQIAEEDFQEQDFYEEEYIIESVETEE